VAQQYLSGTGNSVPKLRLWSYPGGARRVLNSRKRDRDTFLTYLAPPALLGVSLREATSLSATLSREASSTPKEPDPRIVREERVHSRGEEPVKHRSLGATLASPR
jgi:hypothetical protein